LDRAGAVALCLKTARGADADVMDERVFRRLPALLALLQVKRAVEIAVRITPLARSFLEVMHERIDVALGNIRVGRDIIFRIEEPGSFCDLVVAEKCCHSVPA